MRSPAIVVPHSSTVQRASFSGRPAALYAETVTLYAAAKPALRPFAGMRLLPDFTLLRRITLLGTGVPIPSPHRFGPSTLVQAGRRAVLIDAGRGAPFKLSHDAEGRETFDVGVRGP